MGCTDSKEQDQQQQQRQPPPPAAPPSDHSHSSNPLAHRPLDNTSDQKTNNKHKKLSPAVAAVRATAEDEVQQGDALEITEVSSPMDASAAKPLAQHDKLSTTNTMNHDDDEDANVDPLQITEVLSPHRNQQQQQQPPLRHEDIPKIPFPVFSPKYPTSGVAQQPPHVVPGSTPSSGSAAAAAAPPQQQKQQNPFLGTPSENNEKNKQQQEPIMIKKANPNATNPRDRPLNFSLSDDTTTTTATGEHDYEQQQAQLELIRQKTSQNLTSPTNHNQKRRLSHESSLLLAAATLAVASHESECDDHLGSTGGGVSSQGSPRAVARA